jgi:uncharacterized protein involved in response to NO
MLTMTDAIHRPAAVHSFWSLGFRPFFLLAALAAGLLMPIWGLFFAGDLGVPTRLAPPIWHGHEMLFGFTAAVIAGFLLTAVPNWTGIPAVKGGRLIALVALWVAGRLAVFYAALLPAWLVAAIDVAFFPALILAIAPALVASGSRRNMGFPVVLLVFTVANLAIHAAGMGYFPLGAEIGIKVAAGLVTLLMIIIGGRVIPGFTANALGTPSRRADWTDKAVVYAAIAVLLLELLPQARLAQGAAAVAAAVLVVLRMRGWQSLRTARRPILWVLHLGYAWIAVGFAFKGLALLTEMLRWQDALHGLTAGAIGTLTLGMMSRVALGHTGRPLQVSPAITAAYILITLATVIRLCTPFAAALHPVQALTHVAGGLWATAFLIYLIIYAPMLIAPRADGRP